ncbi:MAG: hypothetical protein AAFR18_18480 [Cyanobacteria bacterium J06627_32]
MKLNSAAIVVLFTVLCFSFEKPSALAAVPQPSQPRPPQNGSLFHNQINKLSDSPQRYLRLPSLPFYKQAPSHTSLASPVQTSSTQSPSTRQRVTQEQSTEQEQSAERQKVPPKIQGEDLGFSRKQPEKIIKKTFQQPKQTRKEATHRTFERRNPYSIIAAARQKHSPLQAQSISFDKPAISPSIDQLTERISRAKTQLASDIKQHPKRLRDKLAIATADLQKQSTRKLKDSTNNIRALFQKRIKAPLRNLLQKIEAAAHKAAEQLQ